MEEGRESVSNATQRRWAQRMSQTLQADVIIPTATASTDGAHLSLPIIPATADNFEDRRAAADRVIDALVPIRNAAGLTRDTFPLRVSEEGAIHMSLRRIQEAISREQGATAQEREDTFFRRIAPLGRALPEVVHERYRNPEPTEGVVPPSSTSAMLLNNTPSFASLGISGNRENLSAASLATDLGGTGNSMSNTSLTTVPKLLT